MRKCLATGVSLPKSELIRVVRTPEGNIVVDDTGKVNGRGAYLSKKLEAIELAKRKKVLDRQLEARVEDVIYEELCKRVKE